MQFRHGKTGRHILALHIIDVIERNALFRIARIIDITRIRQHSTFKCDGSRSIRTVVVFVTRSERQRTGSRKQPKQFKIFHIVNKNWLSHHTIFRCIRARRTFFRQ